MQLPNRYQVIWVLLLLLMSTYLCLPIGDPDLWWHITVGRWIISHKQVPTTDHWNMFAVNTPWRAYSWSNEVLFAFFEQHWQEYGLIILQLGFAIILAVTITLSISLVAADYFFGIVFGLICLAACSHHFDLRPQTLSWALFAACLFVSDCIIERGSNVKADLLLVALLALWSNSHISIPLGFLGIALWLFEPTDIKHSLIVITRSFAAAFIGTLLTPYLGKEWLTTFESADHPFTHIYISEFQPATLYHATANILLLLLVVAIIFNSYQRNPRNITRLISACGFTLLAFTIQKFIPYAAIFNTLVIADAWRTSRRYRETLGNFACWIEQGKDIILNLKLHSYISIGVLLIVTSGLLFHRTWKNPINDTKYVPVKAVDFILENKLPLPILNSFNSGGYLIYRLSDAQGNPTQLVPIDGRTNVNKKEIVQAYLLANRGHFGWQDYFNLVQPKTVIWENIFPLPTILLESTDWCLVYPQSRTELLKSMWSVFISKQEFEKGNWSFGSLDCKQGS